MTFHTMTNGERIDYLKEHFMYEVHMLFFSLIQSILIIEKLKSKETMVLNKINKTENELDELNELNKWKNITIECLLMHARNLLEFFYDEKKMTSDRIQAWHFYENIESWKRICPQKTIDINNLSRRVNTEVTHLGSKRTTIINEKQWNLTQINHDFMDIVKCFIENIPSKYKSDELKKY